MPFLDSLDIANRALQHVGQAPIIDVDEDSARNRECSNAYDKTRRAELQRNVWRFAVKKTCLRPVETSTYLLNPPIYDATATYLRGAIVRDENGLLWVSKSTANINNTPGGNNEAWDAYFGPMTVHEWSDETSYNAGELVYVASTDGSYVIYMSLLNGNEDDPATADDWDATTTYRLDETVSYSGSQWRSLIPVNLNHTPADGPLEWDATSTYAAAETVTASDNFIYTSVSGSNVGHNPVTDGGVHWTKGIINGWSRTPSITVSAKSWLPVATSGLSDLTIIYPLGCGPATQSNTRNLYRLPAGYLRHAHQDPKAGAISSLGAPGALPADDWEFDGPYIVSAMTDVIILRFVADVTVVRDMDDMFCEGFACRIAESVCAPLTQSNSNLQTIASEYQKFMGEARLINAIEEGSEEPPLDDYIACRA